MYSILVAATGIAFPIALSFLLIPMTSQWKSISGLTAFAAGASLASTSLGTTYAVLFASNLVQTRVGTILATAAMLDDVVGLVMVKIYIVFESGCERASSDPARCGINCIPLGR